MAQSYDSVEERKSQKINPVGLLGSGVVFGAEIAGEEIDKAMNNNGEKPFMNATDLARVAVTIGPVIANVAIASNSKVGRIVDGITRPMVYGGMPLMAKSLKYAVWTWMGKPAGTKASGLNVDTGAGPQIIVRGERPAASGTGYSAPSEVDSYSEVSGFNGGDESEALAEASSSLGIASGG